MAQILPPCRISRPDGPQPPSHLRVPGKRGQALPVHQVCHTVHPLQRLVGQQGGGGAQVGEECLHFGRRSLHCGVGGNQDGDTAQGGAGVTKLGLLGREEEEAGGSEDSGKLGNSS